MFKSKFLKKLAYSVSTKNEVVTRFGKKPTFPKDEAEVDKVLKHIDTLLPADSAKAKVYTLWMAKQLFDMTPPGFVLGEDDYKVKPLLEKFDKAVKDQKLKAEKADINKYPTLEDVTKSMKSFEDEAGNREVAPYTQEQQEAIKKGAEIIYDQGPWKMFRVMKSNGKANAAAAMALCDNPRNSVSWCVGRGTTGYIAEGNFYVLEKNNVSVYAISTNSHSATIWNPADTAIWTTSGSSGKAPETARAAQTMGVLLELDSISALPAEIIPILKSVLPKDKYLSERIPEDNLKEGDLSNLDKVVFNMSAKGLVKDLNSLLSNSRSVGLGAALLSAAIRTKKPLAEIYPEMQETTMVAYIELLAAAGYKALPKEFEDYIVSELEKA